MKLKLFCAMIISVFLYGTAYGYTIDVVTNMEAYHWHDSFFYIDSSDESWVDHTGWGDMGDYEIVVTPEIQDTTTSSIVIQIDYLYQLSSEINYSSNVVIPDEYYNIFEYSLEPVLHHSETIEIVLSDEEVGNIHVEIPGENAFFLCSDLELDFEDFPESYPSLIDTDDFGFMVVEMESNAWVTATILSVPEPSCILLLCTGFVGLAGLRKILKGKI